jgi:outer membrane biosynthesis protein TonB
MLRRSPPLDLSEQSLAFSELMLDLVIDSAGKVRSAQPTGGAPWADAELKDAVRRWKFIPAFRQGRAVASRTGLAVSLKR